MKNILVVYYSQTGQLREILDSLLTPLSNNESINITYEALEPQPPYPFPWDRQVFCDAFPESFQEIPCKLAPVAMDTEKQFDLVIIAYTIWYLTPSIPITAFFQSDVAERLIKNRPVVTVIGCRNMWLMAQEKVKKRIKVLGGYLTGNIVFTDRTLNLIGIVTIAHWMFSGRKDRLWRIFPKPGVSDEDIQGARRYGLFIKDALQKTPFHLDQAAMNQQVAMTVVPAYILFEKRIEKIFGIWSTFIRQKGGPGSPARQKRVRAFYYYLLVAIYVLAPLATIITFVIRWVKKDKLRKAVAYFSQNTLKP